MQPLTAEQEMILTSHDQIANDDQIRNEASTIVPDTRRMVDDCNPEFHTGTNMNLFSHKEIGEDFKESSLDGNQHPELSQTESSTLNSIDFDVNRSSSTIDNLQNAANVDGVPVLSTSNPTLEVSSYKNLDSSPDVSSSEDSHEAASSGSLDSFTELDPNQNVSNQAGLFSLNSGPNDHTNDHQEENQTHVDKHLDLSSEIKGQCQSHPSISSREILVPGGIFDSPGSTQESADPVAAVLGKENVEHSAILRLPAEARNTYIHDSLTTVTSGTVTTVTSGTVSEPDLHQNEELLIAREPIKSIEGHSLFNDAPSEAYSAEFLANPRGSEPVIPSQIDRRSTYESAEKPNSSTGIPAPSLVSAALQVPPGKVLVPAVVDHVQGQAFAALQVLKVPTYTYF